MPLLPLLVDPVDSTRVPLTPAAPPLAVSNTRLPLVVVELYPVMTVTLPPVVPAVMPAATVTDPPTPAEPAPTVSEIAPPAPPVATPVVIVTGPLFLLLLPVLTNAVPLHNDMTKT